MITTLKHWGDLGTHAASQIIRSSLFLGNSHSLELRDDAWKAYLITLCGDRRRTFQALSQAILCFPRVSFQHLHQAYSLFVVRFSFLPVSSQFMQRSMLAARCTPFALFGFHLWKYDTRQRWYQDHIHTYRSYGASTHVPWLIASVQQFGWQQQLSHHCVQTQRVHTLQFPQHARGHLTGNWCTAPPNGP